MKSTLTELLKVYLSEEDKKKGEEIGKKIFHLLADAFDLDVNAKENIKTQYSSALNAYDSAYCVTYPVRTRRSLQATMNRLNQSEQEVLYIGTGPFAPYFLFPLLLGVKAKFTLLEINAYSLEILNKIIEKFELENFVLNVIEADATIWQIDRNYDTVLCETSDVGLRREDTLPIYQNLVKQLPTATFIPKDVIILAGSGKTNIGYPFDSLNEAIERGSLDDELPVKWEDQPFIQNRILLDDEITIEPYESIVTMPLFLKQNQKDYAYKTS